jgi:hypothetical protein
MKNRVLYTNLAILAMALLGFLLRMVQLLEDPGWVNPDSHRHFQAAVEMVWWNPLSWIAVYRGYFPFALWNSLLFSIAGADPLVQRFGTIVISFITAILIGYAVEKRVAYFSGVLATFTFATSPPLIVSAVQGIRTELTLFLWVLLYLIVQLPLSKRFGASRRSAAFGMTAALLFFNRVDMLPALGVFSAIVLIASKGWRHGRIWLPGASVFVGMVIAVMAANAFRYGEPLYFVDTQKSVFRYWANTEFAGQPGFPSKEEVGEDPRAGEPLTAWKYFMETLGPREALSRICRGYRSLLTGNFATGIYDFTGFPEHIGLAGLLSLIGLGAALWGRDWILILMPPVLALNSIWTYHHPEHDFRFYYAIIPFAIILICLGMKTFLFGLGGIMPRSIFRPVAGMVLFAFLLNPWNHDRAISFPFLKGPVGTVPQNAETEPIEIIPGVALVGWEVRRPGWLGIGSFAADSFEAGERLWVRLYFERTTEDPVSSFEYTFFLSNEATGEFGTIATRKVDGDRALRSLREGGMIRENFDYVIYPRTPPGKCQVRLRVESQGETFEIQLGELEVLPLGWNLVDPTDWG